MHQHYTFTCKKTLCHVLYMYYNTVDTVWVQNICFVFDKEEKNRVHLTISTHMLGRPWA